MRCYFPDQVIRRSRSCLGCAFLLSLSLLDRLLWGRLAAILDRGLPVACFKDAQAAYGQGHVVRKWGLLAAKRVSLEGGPTWAEPWGDYSPGQRLDFIILASQGLSYTSLWFSFFFQHWHHCTQRPRSLAKLFLRGRSLMGSVCVCVFGKQLCFDQRHRRTVYFQAVMHPVLVTGSLSICSSFIFRIFVLSLVSCPTDRKVVPCSCWRN